MFIMHPNLYSNSIVITCCVIIILTCISLSIRFICNTRGLSPGKVFSLYFFTYVFIRISLALMFNILAPGIVIPSISPLYNE